MNCGELRSLAFWQIRENNKISNFWTLTLNQDNLFVVSTQTEMPVVLVNGYYIWGQFREIFSTSFGVVTPYTTVSNKHGRQGMEGRGGNKYATAVNMPFFKIWSKPHFYLRWFFKQLGSSLASLLCSLSSLRSSLCSIWSHRVFRPYHVISAVCQPGLCYNLTSMYSQKAKIAFPILRSILGSMGGRGMWAPSIRCPRKRKEEK